MEKEIATFGGGCFWCTEAIFQSLNGVISVESGFSGGNVEKPSYQEVSSGGTQHAEVIQVTFDHKKITFEDLLEIFFETHDPTSVNQQGNDLGTQYRSIILYHDNKQKEIAESVIKNLNESNKYGKPIATELKKFESFFKAEDYHQNYYKNNPGNPYCTFIISPKLKKLKDKFANKVKSTLL